MNLQEFINLRDKCPFCNTALITRFISDRKQMVRLEDNRFVAVMTMRTLKNSQQDYQIGYSFGLKDNSFQVEFYTEWDTYSQVPMHLIDKFREFHKNVMTTRYRFARHCTSCYKYLMQSTNIIINFNTTTYSDIKLGYERFLFTFPTEDGYKIVMLGNLLDQERINLAYPDPVAGPISELRWWRTDRDDDKLDPEMFARIHNRHNEIMPLPLIPFVSKEETGRRLSNLITFS